MKRNFDTPEYKAWRQAVLKRDGHKCRWPNCKKHRRLQVHHIRTWAKNLSLRFMVSNGISLCSQHHKNIKGKEHHYVTLFTYILSVQTRKDK